MRGEGSKRGENPDVDERTAEVQGARADITAGCEETSFMLSKRQKDRVIGSLARITQGLIGGGRHLVVVFHFQVFNFL